MSMKTAQKYIAILYEREREIRNCVLEIDKERMRNRERKREKVGTVRRNRECIN